MKQKDKNENKIIMYAIADNGQGRVMEIGRYNSIEEIGEIIIGMFDRDVVLSFEEKDEQN